MMRIRCASLFALASVLGCTSPTGDAGDPDDGPGEPAAGAAAQPVVTCPNNNPLKNVYFGDLHSHTSYSLDAYTWGTRVEPADAYAFAAGVRPVAIASGAGKLQHVGPTVTIDRPLDFLAVTDHSEFFNVDYGCEHDPTSPYYKSAYCVALRNQGSAAQLAETGATLALLGLQHPVEPPVCLGGDLLGGTPAQCAAEAGRAWQNELQATRAANNPCHFTSLIAYEWTATSGANNLHRNVVFQSDAIPPAPLDYLHYPSTHDLWAGLSQQCLASDGCAALTIPHNSNYSGGQMFTVNDADVDYMVKYQTLAEIHQHKGSSECLSGSDPGDSGYDPQCDFEVVPGRASATDKPGYVRPALESGISYYASHTGAARKNPLQLGIVAATDTHNGTPGNVKESTWPGHIGTEDDTPRARVGRQNDSSGGKLTENFNQNWNPGGITGVWAEQNTRDRIFAALQRREVFGTSGPRIKVRLYEFTGAQDPCADPSFPRQLVASGAVPMGGTIPDATRPRKFVVFALKDTTDLAEVDIFKATVVNGAPVESLQKIPVSGGSACVTWEDERFDPASPALYYARVLEQPTPRWSHYDCLALKQTNPSDWQRIAPNCAPGGGLDVNIQERAWTSPIWSLP